MSRIKFRLLLTGLICVGTGVGLIFTSLFSDDKHPEDLVAIGASLLSLGIICLGILYLIYFIQRRHA